MSHSESIPIAAWLRRILARNALTAASLVGVLLLATAWIGNDWVAEHQERLQRGQALERLQEITDQQAALAASKLQRIAADVEWFAHKIAQALKHPTHRRLDLYKRIQFTPGGDLHSTGESRGFSFFYSAINPIGQAQADKVQRLLRIDPLMHRIVQRNPDVQAAHFTSHDSLGIVFPAVDPLAMHIPGSDLTEKPPYSQAEMLEQTRLGAAWTETRIDPLSGARLASCMARVQRGDTFEGYAGVDVVLAGIVPKPDSGLPWGGSLFVHSGDGTLLASHPSLTGQRLPPPEQLRKAFQQGRGTALLGKAGKQLLAWAKITGTDWHIALLVPQAPVLADIQQTHQQVRNGILLLAAGVLVLLGLLLVLTARQAHRRAEDLTAPLAQMRAYTDVLATGASLPETPHSGLRELQSTGRCLVSLKHRLEEDNRIRQAREETLRSTCQALRNEALTRSSQLEMETRRRKRLQSAQDAASGYDPDTGLPAGPLFFDRASQALRFARRTRSSLSVLLLEMQDTPEEAGAAGIPTIQPRRPESGRRRIVEYLQQQLQPGDTLAHLGKNDLVILLLHPDSARAPEPEETIKKLGLHRVIDEQRAQACGFLGLARFPDDADSVEELLHQADLWALRSRDKDRFCVQIKEGRSREQ